MIKYVDLAEDIGINILATDGNGSIGIQVKKYVRRKVNLSMVYHIYGAAAFHDCSRAVIVTLSDLTPRAVAAVNKLNVEVWGKDKLLSLLGETLVMTETLNHDNNVHFI